MARLTDLPFFARLTSLGSKLVMFFVVLLVLVQGLGAFLERTKGEA